MSISELIEHVTEICRKNEVKRLDLFGSFATGTAAPTSDIDFVVYGCPDIIKLEKNLKDIDTLRKIDIFEYEAIHNKFLLENIKKYGKQIYYPLQYILQKPAESGKSRHTDPKADFVLEGTVLDFNLTFDKCCGQEISLRMIMTELLQLKNFRILSMFIIHYSTD